VILTDMCAGYSEEDLQALANETPLGRNGQPEDVANAIAFLLEAEFITGHVLNVDGGFVI
jgi:3-oxoacyl-[acyl-carrier protein] reductase